MAEAVKNLVARFGVQWKGLGPGQRFLAVSLVVGAVLTIAVSVLVTRHVTYAILYAGLESTEASEVVDKLRETKTPFRLKDSGRTILVPEAEVYSIRLQMAGEGGPGSGGTGYEIFDESSFGMTNFMQKVNYRRALEGELTRTIRQMDEVISARVHLVIPERTLFADDLAQTSASVMIRVKPSVRLSRKQVEGIARLVSGSVQGLEPANVNILDYYGNLLTAGDSELSLDGSGTGRFEVESNLERALERKAQTLLDRVVGPGNAIVRVNAVLDFQRVERDSETYDPDNASVRSEEVSEESGSERGEFRNSVTNYELNRTVEKLTKTPGDVIKLSVAVTVGGHYVMPEGAEGEGKDVGPQWVPRDVAELEELAALVRNAVGFDQERGDQFHIACVPLDREHLMTERADLAKAERNLMIREIVEKLLWLIGAIVFFVIMRRIIGSIARVMSEAVPPPVAATEAMPAAQSAIAPGRSGAAPAGGGEVGRVEQEIGSVSARISELATERPGESAGVLRSMITEDDA